MIPPSLSVDNQDAGVNSPPAITSVRSADQELPEGATVNFQIGDTSGLFVTMVDSDIADNLYVRVYVNYTVTTPVNWLGQCKLVPPTGTAIRTCQVDTTALCATGDDSLDSRFMGVQVFDRDLAESGAPLFKRMVDSGGQTTSRGFILKCTPAEQ